MPQQTRGGRVGLRGLSSFASLQTNLVLSTRVREDLTPVRYAPEHRMHMV